MKNLLITCLSMLFFIPKTMAKEEITIKGITSGNFSAEYISGINPIQGMDQYVQISPNQKQLLQFSFRTGKQTAVLFDCENTQGEKINKLDGYILSPDKTKILIRTKTTYIYRRSNKAIYYIYNTKTHKLEKLSQGGSQQVPTWSPDGTQIAFVRDNNLFLVKLLYDNAETQVTRDGKFNNIINGIPDWVYEEEFSFNKAFTFTADGSMLCWIKFDESKVKTFSLQQYNGLKPELKKYDTYPGEYQYKYPKAGEDNSKVTVWSYDIKTKKTQQLNVPLPEDGYIPRIKAMRNDNNVLVFTLNRHQDNLRLYTVNPRSRIAKLLINESVPKYIKENVLSETIIGENSILMPSDRDGFMHLYLYSLNGKLIKKITNGNCDVTSVYGYDEKTGNVYYQACLPTPYDRQIMMTNKNGKTITLTKKEGWNDAIFSGDYKYFVNIWSDRNTPYVFSVVDNRGNVLSKIKDNKKLEKQLEQYKLGKIEMFNFTTSEGVKLNGWILKPQNFDKAKKYPVILFQYSGPGSQQVVNSWNIGSMRQGAMFDHYMAQEGFIVACVDGRGTGGRGAEFEKTTYLKLGEKESKDQVETALYLATLPFVDAANIGIWGWSYGGFNTLMSMSEGRGVFKAGVAVAPPTDFRFYDTVYTERYMRTPKENANGYADNPINRADKLHGSLMVCHGLADDNVHPQHSFEYAEALVQADKDFTQIWYTNRNHGIYGGNSRNHLLRQIANFFKKQLQNK